MNNPRLRDHVLLFIMASFFAILAIYEIRFAKGPLPDWLKLFFRAIAIICAVSGIVSMGDWLAHRFNARLREFNHAKIAHLALLADRMKGLTLGQTDILSRHDMPEIFGVLGGTRIHWSVRCISDDVPLDFIHDVLEKSIEYRGHLLPVREANKLTSDWINSPKMLQSFTNLLIQKNIAEKAAGPYPAKLKYSLVEIGNMFGLEI